MKKIFAVLLVISLLALMFTGCKKEPGEETTTSSQEEITSSSSSSGDIITEQISQTDTVEESTTAVSTSEQTSNEVQTTAQSSTETTSSESISEATTVKEEVTVNTDVSAPNEYDILRSGTFHIVGSVVESNGINSPLEMAVTPGSVYMLSEFSEGVDIGILVYNDTIYMLYPEKKAYAEMDDSIMSMVGLSIDDLMSGNTVDFSSFGSLDEAFKVTDEKINGVPCKVYHIKEDKGEMRVYMNGNKLMRFASYNTSGAFLTATDVNTISDKVPAEKSAPPADYKAYKGITGMFTFMTFFTDVM